ncbi:MAG: hypothetical protein II483_08570 [Lachnospiraceae bacterium]|nr:hypothetical protein [Lachnospiraceae bacterium]MCR5376081.1 hypothetical protein [Lachnospiraceae bacterium]
MFRLWAKMWKENRLLRDMTVEDDSGANRTKKVFDAVEKVCVAWDLPKPIWLQANIRDFKHRAKTRFGQDSFIEHVDFDWLEIHVIEEDR